MANYPQKLTVQEALNAALNSDRDALKVDLEGANIAATLDVQLDSANDSVTSVPTPGSASVLAADGQVKASAGTVYSVMISMNGVVAGDKVEIKNSTDASGSVLLSFVATAAAQSFMFNPSVGITYAAGIYADVTISSGTVSVTTVYI